MKEKGNQYIELNEMHIMKPFLQYLYYLSTLFTKLKAYMRTINICHYALYKFENYQYIDNKQDTIVKKYIKKDPYLGQNTRIDTNLSYCKTQENNVRTPNIDIVIK